MSNDNLPQQFTKKQVTIEAVQWDGSYKSMRAIEAVTGLITAGATSNASANTVVYWEIVTLEGKHRVSPNDWIIKGVKGEFYPCKPDIFVMTYEAGKRDAVAASGAGVPVYQYRQKAGINEWIECDSRCEERMKLGPAADCFEYRTLYAAAPTPDSDGGAASVRDAALEEAARLVMARFGGSRQSIAKAIRALKAKP